MKILLVTPFFYPQNVIAVSRVGQWSKYLSQLGHDVTVLTTKKYPFWPLDHKVVLPDDIKIVEVDYLPFFLKKIFGFSSTNKVNSASRDSLRFDSSFILRKIKLKITQYFDPHDLWIFPASKVGLTLAAKHQFDVIISSYSPAAAHHVARNIKSRYDYSIWVADFRDLWAKNHLSTRGRLGSLLENIREKFCMQSADILITISKPLAEVLQYSYPNKKLEVIANGYDPDDFSEFTVLNNQAPNPSSHIVISYTGMIYEDRRDPSPLLFAINSLIDSGDIQKDDIVVNFYGPSKLVLNKIINAGNFNRHNFINVFDQVSRKQSIDIQKKSDILLLLEWSDVSSRGVLTGKLFEYLVSGRPVLGIGVHPESEAGLLIGKAQVGLASSDVEVIKEILVKYLKTRIFHQYQPNVEEIKRYSRDRQVINLIKIIQHYSNDKSRK